MPTEVTPGLIIGAFVCFGSITVSDARRNAGCEDACEEAVDGGTE